MLLLKSIHSHNNERTLQAIHAHYYDEEIPISLKKDDCRNHLFLYQKIEYIKRST